MIAPFTWPHGWPLALLLAVLLSFPVAAEEPAPPPARASWAEPPPERPVVPAAPTLDRSTLFLDVEAPTLDPVEVELEMDLSAMSEIDPATDLAPPERPKRGLLNVFRRDD